MYNNKSHYNVNNSEYSDNDGCVCDHYDCVTYYFLSSGLKKLLTVYPPVPLVLLVAA